jgi:hypothetical protein
MYSPSVQGLYRSLDGGETWSLGGADVRAPLIVDPQDPMTVYGTGVPAVYYFPDGLLRRTTDGGVNAADVPVVDPRAHEPNTSANLFLSPVVIDPLNPTTMYVRGSLSVTRWGCEFVCGTDSYVSVYRSTDRGATWQVVPEAASPLFAADTVYVGDRWQLWPEGSANRWLLSRRQSATPPAVPPVGPIGASPPIPAGAPFVTVGRSRMYAAVSCAGADQVTCSGLLRSSDGGATWTPLQGIHGLEISSATRPVAVSRQDPQRIYVHTLGSTSLQTNFTTGDGGATWTLNGQVPGRGAEVVEVDAGTPMTIYATTSDGSKYSRVKSTNGGATWIGIGSDLPPSCEASFKLQGVRADPSRPGVIHSFCDPAETLDPARGLYRSQDGGQHWSLWGDFDGLFGADVPNAIEPPRIETIELFPDPARPLVFHAAVSWSVRTKEGPAPASTVYGTGLAKSIDGGATFTALPPLNPAVGGVTAMAFSGSGTAYLIARLVPNGSAAFKSVDGGLSWTLFGTPSVSYSNGYTDIETHPGTSGVYVSIYDRGVFWVDDAGSGWRPLGLRSVRMLLAPAATAPLYALTATSGIWKLPAPCTAVDFTATAIVGNSGGRRSVYVMTSTPDCLWTASSTSSSITVNSATLRRGPGIVTYDVSANGGGGIRVGAVVIGNAALEVRQGPYPPTHGRLDFNGDGRADVFGIDRRSGQWTVYLSDGGGGFTAAASGGWVPDWTIRPADFNNDGLSDLLLYHAINGLWFRAISDGLGGFSYTSGGWRAGLAPHVMELDADGRSDVLLHDERTGEFWTARSTAEGGFAYTAGGWSVGWTITPLRRPDRTDDLLLYNESSGLFYTASNIGNHRDPASPPLYAGAGWRAGWTLNPLDSDPLLYDPRSGDAFQAIYTGGNSAFSYWPGVRWPGALTIVPVRAVFDPGQYEYVLYAPASGLYYLATGLGEFSYYIGHWPAQHQPYAADFSGDGRDDVLLYDPATGEFTLAIGNGPSVPAGSGWSGFTDHTGTLPAGLELIVTNRPRVRR